MNNSTLKVTGVSRVQNNIRNIRNTLTNNMKWYLNGAGYLLRDGAINFLYDNSRYPPSVEHQSIRDPNSWTVQNVNDTTVKLICNSEHAAVVEVGGELTGTTTIYPRGDTPMPVGKNQGIITYYAYSVRMQTGKHYIINTAMNPDIQKKILEDIKYSMLQDIASVIV